MGCNYQELKGNKTNRIVLEKQENIEIQQSPSGYSKKRKSLIRERFFEETKRDSKKPLNENHERITKEVLNLQLLEQLQSRDFVNKIQDTSQQLYTLADTIKNELNKLNEERAFLLRPRDTTMENNKKSKVKTKAKDGSTWSEQLSKNCGKEGKFRQQQQQEEENEISQERFSLKHQCICTSPRYGADKDLAPRPYKRSVGSQVSLKDVESLDHGAVGDYNSKLYLKGKKLKEDLIFDELSKKNSPPVCSQNPTVNCCYGLVYQPSCRHFRRYQQMGETGVQQQLNYCRDEYYYNCPNSCNCNNNNNTANAATNTVAAPTAPPDHRRQYTDLKTDVFYSQPDNLRSTSPALRSSSSKTKTKQGNKTKDKICHHEVQNEPKSKREKEVHSKKRQRSKSTGNKEKTSKGQEGKLFKLLSEDKCMELIKLLDRYVDDHVKDMDLGEEVGKRNETSKEERKTTEISRDSNPKPFKVRSETKLCQITVRKNNQKSSNEPPEGLPTSLDKYSVETLSMLKKMTIKEYKPLKPRGDLIKDSSVLNEKAKRYREYLEKFEREKENVKSVKTLKKPPKTFSPQGSEEGDFFKTQQQDVLKTALNPQTQGEHEENASYQNPRKPPLLRTEQMRSSYDPDSRNSFDSYEEEYKYAGDPLRDNKGWDAYGRMDNEGYQGRSSLRKDQDICQANIREHKEKSSESEDERRCQTAKGKHKEDDPRSGNDKQQRQFLERQYKTEEPERKYYQKVRDSKETRQYPNKETKTQYQIEAERDYKDPRRSYYEKTRVSADRTQSAREERTHYDKLIEPLKIREGIKYPNSKAEDYISRQLKTEDSRSDSCKKARDSIYLRKYAKLAREGDKEHREYDRELEAEGPNMKDRAEEECERYQFKIVDPRLQCFKEERASSHDRPFEIEDSRRKDRAKQGNERYQYKTKDPRSQCFKEEWDSSHDRPFEIENSRRKDRAKQGNERYQYKTEDPRSQCFKEGRAFEIQDSRTKDGAIQGYERYQYKTEDPRSQYYKEDRDFTLDREFELEDPRSKDRAKREFKRYQFKNEDPRSQCFKDEWDSSHDRAFEIEDSRMKDRVKQEYEAYYGKTEDSRSQYYEEVRDFNHDREFELKDESKDRANQEYERCQYKTEDPRSQYYKEEEDCFHDRELEFEDPKSKDRAKQDYERYQFKNEDPRSQNYNVSVSKTSVLIEPQTYASQEKGKEVSNSSWDYENYPSKESGKQTFRSSGDHNKYKSNEQDKPAPQSSWDYNNKKEQQKLTKDFLQDLKTSSGSLGKTPREVESSCILEEEFLVYGLKPEELSRSKDSNSNELNNNNNSSSPSYGEFKEVMDKNLGFRQDRYSQTDYNFKTSVEQKHSTQTYTKDLDGSSTTETSLQQSAQTYTKCDHSSPNPLFTESALHYLKDFLKTVNSQQANEMEDECLKSVTKAASELITKLSSCQRLPQNVTSSNLVLDNESKTSQDKSCNTLEDKLPAESPYQDPESTTPETSEELLKKSKEKAKDLQNFKSIQDLDEPSSNKFTDTLEEKLTAESPNKDPESTTPESSEELRKSKEKAKKLETFESIQDLDEPFSNKFLQETSYYYQSHQDPQRKEYTETFHNYKEYEEVLDSLRPPQDFTDELPTTSARYLEKLNNSCNIQAPQVANIPVFDPDIIPLKGILKPCRYIDDTQMLACEMESKRTTSVVSFGNKDVVNIKTEASKRYTTDTEDVDQQSSQHQETIVTKDSLQRPILKQNREMLMEASTSRISAYTDSQQAGLMNYYNAIKSDKDIPPFKQCLCMLGTYLEMLGNYYKGKKN